MGQGTGTGTTCGTTTVSVPLTGVTVGNALIIGAHSNASFGQTLSSITEGSDTCAIDVSSTSGSFPTDADSIGHCFNVSTTTPTVVAHFTVASALVGRSSMQS